MKLVWEAIFPATLVFVVAAPLWVAVVALWRDLSELKAEFKATRGPKPMNDDPPEPAA